MPIPIENTINEEKPFVQTINSNSFEGSQPSTANNSYSSMSVSSCSALAMIPSSEISSVKSLLKLSKDAIEKEEGTSITITGNSKNSPDLSEKQTISSNN